MYTLLISLIVLASILVVLVVIVQNSKGGGLIGGGSASNIIGVKKTTDVLERVTWGAGAALAVFVLLTNIYPPVRPTGDSVLDDIQSEQVVPSTSTTVPVNPQPADSTK